MKLVTWNCNGALRKKYRELAKLKADIYLVQECEDPAGVLDKDFMKWAGKYLWKGDSKHKGVGVFARPSIKLEALEWGNECEGATVKHFLPCLINDDLQLVNIWTHQNNSPTFGYIGQLWMYHQINKHRYSRLILAGDFNSNVFWDKPSRWWNHSDVTRELNDQGIVSAYHYLKGEEQGKESRPTFYLHRDAKKPYHLDYFYLSQELLTEGSALKLGNRKRWLELSDHLPLVLTL